MPPCSKSGCVAVATREGLCAAHAQGYDQHNGAGELRCSNCRKLFRKGEWFQRRDDGQFHPHACVMHPDIAKALAETTK